MKSIDSILFAEALSEWQTAPRKQKANIVEGWRKAFGVSKNTLHRKFKKAGHMLKQRKTRCDKGISKIEGLHGWVETIAHLYSFIPRRCGRKPPLEYAVKKAILNGMIPEKAKEVSVSTFARVMREKRLLDKDGRCLRFEAKRPMEQMQFDASGSEHLYVHRKEGDEYILRARASKGYKNKDKHENLRLWYHGLVDDHSRYWLAMPFVSPGESSKDAIRFCKWAFSKKDDDRIPFRGLPDRIYMDNGPLARSEATRRFFDLIGVDIKTHEPESPEDTGKIEVKWKSLWSTFEAGEFLMDPHWNKREYTLSDIRERLINYSSELNGRRHPNMAVTKVQAWLKVIHDGGVVDIDEAAFETAFKRSKCKVGRDGVIRLDNERYFIKGLYDTWVYVYEGILDGRMVAEDILTHQRYECEPFKMPGLDEIRTDKKLEYTRVREEAAELRNSFVPGEFKGIYEDKKRDNVVCMPPRTKEKREVEDPFDIANFHDVEEAISYIAKIVAVGLDEEQREALRELLSEEGHLDREYVKDLALDMRSALYKPRLSVVG